jgi:hypothetical protein
VVSPAPPNSPREIGEHADERKYQEDTKCIERIHFILGERNCVRFAGQSCYGCLVMPEHFRISAVPWNAGPQPSHSNACNNLLEINQIREYITRSVDYLNDMYVGELVNLRDNSQILSREIQIHPVFMHSL